MDKHFHLRRALPLLLALLLALSALTSCGTARYYSGFSKSSLSEGAVLLGPVSTMYYLDKDNREFHVDSLSVASEQLLTRLVGELQLPVTEIIPMDSLQKEEAVAFMRYIAGLGNKKHIGYAPIPSGLDEVLKAQGKRYGLLLYANGMTRDRKGYAKDLSQGLLLGAVTAVLSMGSVVSYSVAIPYVSHIYAAVLDTGTERVVFYNYSTPTESHPLRENSVRGQLRSVFRDFLK